LGNCLASAVIARWEGELDESKMHNPAFLQQALDSDE
jgi:hypothetical protein